MLLKFQVSLLVLAAPVSFSFRSSCELSRGEFLSEVEEEKGRKKRRASHAIG